MRPCLKDSFSLEEYSSYTARAPLFYFGKVLMVRTPPQTVFLNEPLGFPSSWGLWSVFLAPNFWPLPTPWDRICPYQRSYFHPNSFFFFHFEDCLYLECPDRPQRSYSIWSFTFRFSPNPKVFQFSRWNWRTQSFPRLGVSFLHAPSSTFSNHPRFFLPPAKSPCWWAVPLWSSLRRGSFFFTLER